MKTLKQAVALVFLAISICTTMGASFSSAEEPGVAHRSPDGRHIDHGNKTITDTRTGLMWMQDDSYLHTGHWLNWFEAQDYIKDLNSQAFAGYLDWRMPTIKELVSLYEEDKINSSQVGTEMSIHIDPLFGKEGSGAIWSSEPNGRFNAFGVVFNTGNKFNGPKKSRSRKAVRAVRSPGP